MRIRFCTLHGVELDKDRCLRCGTKWKKKHFMFCGNSHCAAGKATRPFVAERLFCPKCGNKMEHGWEHPGPLELEPPAA